MTSHKYPASIFTFKTPRWCLKQFLADRLAHKPSDHLQKVFDMCNKVNDMDNASHTVVEWLDLNHDCHDFTTKYFKDLNRKYDDFFWDLLRAHFSRSPTCSFEAREKVRRRKEKPRNGQFNEGHPWRSEQVTMQWENIPHYVAFMQDLNKKAYDDSIEIEEAWITLYFRGMCWGQCHQQDSLVDGQGFLPAQWYNSQLPVFLL
jgi:hypothetical protein